MKGGNYESRRDGLAASMAFKGLKDSLTSVHGRASSRPEEADSFSQIRPERLGQASITGADWMKGVSRSKYNHNDDIIAPSTGVVSIHLPV